MNCHRIPTLGRMGERDGGGGRERGLGRERGGWGVKGRERGFLSGYGYRFFPSYDIYTGTHHEYDCVMIDRLSYQYRTTISV